MENCLKTQLKESVNNDNLNYLGYVTFNLKALDNATETQSKMLFYNVTKIEAINGGYFVDSFSDVNDSTKYKTSFESQEPVANKTIYLVNANGRLKVKSDITGLVLNGISEPTAHIANLDIEQLAYCNLSRIRIPFSTFRGNIRSLGNISELIGASMFDIHDTQITGSVEEYVSKAVDNGNTIISTPYNINGLLSLCTFGGKKQLVAGQVFSIQWNGKNIIAVHQTSGNKVFTKGYSQAEAEAAFSGETCISVDGVY